MHSTNDKALLGADTLFNHHRDGDGEIEVDDPEDYPLEENEEPRFHFSWRKLLKFMGPGWLMSLAYLDPGNLEADLQQGAYTGLQLVWVLWWATVMGLVLQCLAARIGVVTGCDLAQCVHAEYPRWLNYVVYVMMEIAVIASDIQEVVGSAIAITLLSQGVIPVWAGCLITGLDTFTFLAVHYFGVRYLEALICLLISVMSICFFVNWGESAAKNPAGLELVKGWVVPMMSSYAITQAVGTIGAVIMPHNLYLHSGLVLSRKVKRSSPASVNDAIWYNSIESAMALLVSFFINLAIVATNAAFFYVPACAELDGGPFACLSPYAFNHSGDGGDFHGVCELPAGRGSGVCAEIGLDGEGAALRAALGSAALYIWAIGLLAAGQAATMTCTYAGQIIMGGCLQIELAPWKRVAFTRAIALGPALLVATLTIGDTHLYNSINEYLNVLQSVQLPFAMLPVLHFSVSKKLLGRYVPHPAIVGASFAMALLVLGVNFFLIIQTITADGTPSAGVLAAVGICGSLYVFFCLCLVWDELAAVAAAVDRTLCGRLLGVSSHRYAEPAHHAAAVLALPPNEAGSSQSPITTSVSAGANVLEPTPGFLDGLLDALRGKQRVADTASYRPFVPPPGP